MELKDEYVHPIHGSEGPDVVDPSMQRLLALSDGVFAIAMTVLVFQLTIPEITRGEHGSLGLALLALLPKVGTYCLGFLFMSGYWIAHRRIFRWLERGDIGLCLLNITLLMLIAFLPFPTAVLGQHGYDPAAVMFFAGTLTLIGLNIWLLWWHAVHDNRLISPHLHTRVAVKHHALPLLLTPAVFLTSIAIAPLSATLAKLWWTLIFVLPTLVAFYYRMTGQHHLWRSIMARW
jgi:uncharacterized membrane protein